MKKKFLILFLILISVLSISLVDGLMNVNYWVKSLIKILLFLCFPLIYFFVTKENIFKIILRVSSKNIKFSFIIGILIYLFILFGYFVFKKYFDFSTLLSSLEKNVGVNKNNFVLVSFYISFINSFLEEFYFRGFSFLILKENFSRTFCYIFSSLIFSLYHVAIMIGWFRFDLTLLIIFSLFIGALIFNYISEKTSSIYSSWFIHMFANFSINTIGFLMFYNIF